LLLGFLDETISSLENKINNISYEPFGSKPWPCLNKAANHFQEAVVDSCVITRDFKTHNPVGTFACDCGFVYSRKGPDKNADDRYKIGRIKSFGVVWKRKLGELSKQDLSLRKKAVILGVDPMTVKNKLNPKMGCKENDLTEVLEEYRRTWSLLLENNQGKTITEIRSLNFKIYMWLYRNDKGWLYENYPKTVVKTQVSKIRIDWDKRDTNIAKQVKLIAKEIISDTEELIRVTKNEVGRRMVGISLAALYKNLKKMPKTQKALNTYIESIEQFQIRRIRYIAKTNPSFKEWELIRAAGLSRKFVEKHKEFIKKLFSI